MNYERENSWKYFFLEPLVGGVFYLGEGGRGDFTLGVGCGCVGLYIVRRFYIVDGFYIGCGFYIDVMDFNMSVDFTLEHFTFAVDFSLWWNFTLL